jgi:hypothetical protein
MREGETTAGVATTAEATTAEQATATAGVKNAEAMTAEEMTAEATSAEAATATEAAMTVVKGAGLAKVAGTNSSHLVSPISGRPTNKTFASQRNPYFHI